MKKFDKGILITSIISLILTMMLGTVTGIVAVSNAIKYMSNDGIKDVFMLMEFGTEWLDEITENKQIVVTDNGEQRVIIDFSNGIHVESDGDVVDINSHGIQVSDNN